MSEDLSIALQPGQQEQNSISKKKNYRNTQRKIRGDAATLKQEQEPTYHSNKKSIQRIRNLNSKHLEININSRNSNFKRRIGGKVNESSQEEI